MVDDQCLAFAYSFNSKLFYLLVIHVIATFNLTFWLLLILAGLLLSLLLIPHLLAGSPNSKEKTAQLVKQVYNYGQYD